MRKNNTKVYKQIAAAIKRHKTFFLTGHKKPDGDTVASELAMASLLRRCGKQVELVNREPVPEQLSFLKGVEEIKHAQKIDKSFDVAIVFECSEPERMGNIIDLKKQAKLVINIDHHLKHSFFGDINLIDVEASSNSEQLFYLFQQLKLPLREDEATALYLGIMADTGRFQYSNTNCQTLKIASELLKQNVNVSFLCEKMYGTRRLSSLKLLSRALTGLEFIDGGIAVLKVTKKDFKAVQASEEDTDEFVNYGLLIPNSLISLFLRESSLNGIIKVSLRSRLHVNVCKIAEKFGGGGHKYASGCEIKGSMEEVSNQILSLARKSL
ncbi:MAG: bifunctional oligoribonuclease/PAP phosphatase NrnA [Elusimicrobia bacterium]|nr:bifunctional oligoribonuclease/PAP phosphatase NrnA [Elusimicrobiota bacterium]